MSVVQKIDISSSTIFRTVLIILGFWFLYVIRDILLMLLAAFVIAAAIEPLAKKLQRYNIPRGISVTIVYVCVIALLAVAGILIVPLLAEQLLQLAQSLPHLLAGLEERLPVELAPSGLVNQLQQSLGRLGDNLANVSLNVFQQTRTAFYGLLSVIFVLIIAFYMVIEEHAIRKLFSYIIPREHLPYVESVVERVEQKLGRWVLAQVALGIIVGAIVTVGLWLMGVPQALSLGIIAGVLEILPVIGPIVAGFFGVLVGLSQSLLLGVGVLIFYIVVQQVENHALVPNITKRATGLNPLVTLIAVLLGGRIAGVTGVILSIPVATIISIFLSDFFSTTAVDEELPG